MKISQIYEGLTLPPQVIDLWIVEPDKIQDLSLLRSYSTLLTSAEQNRVNSFCLKEHQHSALVTRALNRTVLSIYQNKSPKKWLFARNKYGKPELINGKLPLRFNLSHTQGMIICGVTLHNNLGVDVENITRINNLIKIAKNNFAPEEIQQLRTFQALDKISQFFNFWTLKESYIKAVGKGLKIPLDGFAFTLPRTPGDIIRLSVAYHNQPKKILQTDWQNWIFHGSIKHRIAISIQAPIKQTYQIRFFYGVPFQGFKSTHLTRIA